MQRIEQGLKYDKQVHRIASKLASDNHALRDDLIQEGRIAVLQGLGSYKPEHPEAAAESTWCLKYAYRDMVRFAARQRLHQNNHDDLELLLDVDGVDELIDYDHQHEIEMRVDVFNMLEGLPEPERRMVIAHIFDDLSYAEIAERNSLNKQAVYRVVTIGMGILREKFS